MILHIDSHKLTSFISHAKASANSGELKRSGRVFFIGADLPVYSTLETMYESYCQESSELFHVSFGGSENFDRNIEMVRQIKRNFSIRIMGRISYTLSKDQLESVYLAGVDILDLPTTQAATLARVDGSKKELPPVFKAATEIFSRWSVFSSILAGQRPSGVISSNVDLLLENQIIPLLDYTGSADGWSDKEIASSFSYIASRWHQKRVPLKHVIPLLKLTTPFAFAEKSGYLRDVIDRIEDRRALATSDLRRHLRTCGAEASFESAGL